MFAKNIKFYSFFGIFFISLISIFSAVVEYQIYLDGTPLIIDSNVYSFYPDVKYENVVVYKNSKFYSFIKNNSCSNFDTYRWCISNITSKYATLQLYDGLCELNVNYSLSEFNELYLLNISYEAINDDCINVDLFTEITSSKIYDIKDYLNNIKESKSSYRCKLEDNIIKVNANLTKGNGYCEVIFLPLNDFSVITFGTYYNGIRNTSIINIKNFSVNKKFSYSFTNLSTYYNQSFYSTFRISFENNYDSNVYAIIDFHLDEVVLNNIPSKFKKTNSLKNLNDFYYFMNSTNLILLFPINNKTKDSINLTFYHLSDLPLPLAFVLKIYLHGKYYGNLLVKDFNYSIFEKEGYLLELENSNFLVFSDKFYDEKNITNFLADKINFTISIKDKNISNLVKNNYYELDLELIPTLKFNSLRIYVESDSIVKSLNNPRSLINVEELEDKKRVSYVDYSSTERTLDRLLIFSLNNYTSINVTILGVYSGYKVQKNFTFKINFLEPIKVNYSLLNNLFCFNIFSLFDEANISWNLESKTISFEKDYARDKIFYNKTYSYCTKFNLKDDDLFSKKDRHSICLNFNVTPNYKYDSYSFNYSFCSNEIIVFNLTNITIYSYYSNEKLKVFFVSEQDIDELFVSVLPTENYFVERNQFFFDKIDRKLLYSFEIPIILYNLSKIKLYLRWKSFGHNHQLITIDVLNPKEIPLESNFSRIALNYSVNLVNDSIFFENFSDLSCRFYLNNIKIISIDHPLELEFIKNQVYVESIPVIFDLDFEKITNNFEVYNKTCIQNILEKYYNDNPESFLNFNILTKNDDLVLYNKTMDELFRDLNKKYAICNYKYNETTTRMFLKNFKINLILVYYCENFANHRIISLPWNKTFEKIINQQNEVYYTDKEINEFVEVFKNISKSHYERYMEIKKENEKKKLMENTTQEIIEEKNITNITNTKPQEIRENPFKENENLEDNIKNEKVNKTNKINNLSSIFILIVLVLVLYFSYSYIIHKIKQNKKKAKEEEKKKELYKIPKLKNDED
ncbi:MAG: hypothetical protein QXR30_02220 [Candidatus Woesearchaeota archaeon]